MIRIHAPFYGKRYIGDTSKNIVHDLLSEKDNCSIDTIEYNCVRTFDSIKQAIGQQYRICKFCRPFNHSFPA